ncbi:hypothetical protein T310_2101 [Rasamsonia emersonii CBS 393.64]|uniref:Uncharacterized protein n=1 Tax=Rasamsonia emersonii (strain ATCC 16479 / CBS 393.64 / IMI 116815) TaxID=1408163 RepID=A0A0F4Z0J3_RASE3|nr:hypothetical protein T310_2101 [Rasamsonia emersonii CBS 393.64]KKA23870.1 hypothetical protein T310_2101 [Rasamsonia emersonii CBS 393.64]
MVTLAKGAPEDHQLKPSRRVTFTATSGPRTRSQDVFPASQRGLNPEEETVNAATMSFLQALTLKTPGNDSRWLMRRLALKARFRSGSYEARTDGYLQSKRGNQKLQAIVEVKAKKRGKARYDTSRPDQDEIYLTFASYDQSVVLELSEDWGANSQLPQNGVIWPLEPILPGKELET